mgnify:CR=1 FL=1
MITTLSFHLTLPTFIYLASAFALFVIRSLYLLRTGLGKRTVRKTLDTLLVALVTASVFPLPALYAVTDILGSFDYSLSLLFVAAGAPGLVLATAVMWKAHADLGRNFSIAPGWEGGHRLVREGIYAYLRHPMYTGLLLWSAATPLVLHNLVFGLLPLALSVPFALQRIPMEERMLRRQFGEEYDRYAEGTGALVPRAPWQRREGAS